MNDETAWFADFARKAALPLGACAIWMCLAVEERDALTWIFSATCVGAMARWPYCATLVRCRSMRGSVDVVGVTPPDYTVSYVRMRALEPLVKFLISASVVVGTLVALSYLLGLG